ncbi:hypothetical protein DD595_25365, partial [Enterobacter cloacae complex sp. 4DZ3-17B2]
FNIPIIFHNLSGYDAHFLIREVTNCFEGDVKVIPCNMEKYISIIKFVKDTKIRLTFLDSIRFLNCSLEKLASYLNNNDTRILKSDFPNENEFNLLTCKGIFPYDYVKEMSILDDACLPTQDKFFNKSYECEVSESDYVHARNVWNVLKCNTMGEYSDLYLKTDILLLADIFENFRTTLIKSHGLDPAHYYTLPGYTWDCALKHTQVELQLITDINMVMFIERG